MPDIPGISDSTIAPVTVSAQQAPRNDAAGAAPVDGEGIPEQAAQAVLDAGKLPIVGQTELKDPGEGPGDLKKEVIGGLNRTVDETADSIEAQAARAAETAGTDKPVQVGAGEVPAGEEPELEAVKLSLPEEDVQALAELNGGLAQQVSGTQD